MSWVSKTRNFSDGNFSQILVETIREEDNGKSVGKVRVVADQRQPSKSLAVAHMVPIVHKGLPNKHLHENLVIKLSCKADPDGRCTWTFVKRELGNYLLRVNGIALGYVILGYDWVRFEFLK
jgi:hypothetical protein